MPRITAAFVIDSQEPRAVDLLNEEGVGYGALKLTKSFTGGIDGTSAMEMLYTRTPRDDESFAGGYVGLERISGTIDGRSGSFALLHHSTVAGSESPVLRLLISPSSGTGELAGIAGTAVIHIDDDGAHTLELDYELG